ncbi:heterokaryon incompatibility protein-domain-containing protein, partial [Leptodontidium sp. 2 PMI_412]
MVDSSRSHIYPPLDKSSSKIRLIHLQPRSRNNNIICQLCIVDLDADDLKYEALSYEWGETNISRSILLNGKEFSVRENLWSALTYLRHDEVERVLWIDAICIDQSDKGERNHQVGLMAQVYSRASRVVVWLG